MVTGRIAIVGAGLAGLSAGLELKRQGFEVLLFERSRLLGGKATSFSLDGVEVDNGQHVFLACCTELLDFVRSVGPVPSCDGDPLFLQERFEALLLARGKRPARLRAASLPPPWHLALALLTYQHLPLAARLRMGQAILAARQPARPGETFAAWLERHGQSAVARQAFWDPFMVPALNAPLEVASAEAALFTITTAFLSDSGAARFGFARVPLAHFAEAATQQLDQVQLRTPVVGLDLGDGSNGAPALRAIVLEDGSRVACDGAVLAVPPARLTRILGAPEALGVRGLDAFQPAAIIDVHLWYDFHRPSLPDAVTFAALLDSPVQWVFEKAPGYLCCSMSAADDHAGRSNAELIELCRQELAAVVPGLKEAHLLRGAATRDREATFIPAPRLYRPGPATTCPQVVIAGAWTDTGWPATMESAVRSGRAAARVLTSQVWTPEGVAIG